MHRAPDRRLEAWYRADIEAPDEILRARDDGRVLDLVYEDLHLAPPAEQERVLARLWSFLGCDETGWLSYA